MGFSWTKINCSTVSGVVSLRDSQYPGVKYYYRSTSKDYKYDSTIYIYSSIFSISGIELNSAMVFRRMVRFTR